MNLHLIFSTTVNVAFVDAGTASYATDDQPPDALAPSIECAALCICLVHYSETVSTFTVDDTQLTTIECVVEWRRIRAPYCCYLIS